jgi:cytoskeletal protein CcmA (bactofilin family)
VSSTTGALTRSGGATTVLNKKTKGRERNAADTGASGLSIISKDMHIRGSCQTDGQLLIEGRISGTVTAHGVELVASGLVDGNVIAAEDAKSTQAFIICGRVTGAVHAALVEVRLGGKVDGGVVADEAVIHGQVHCGVLARNRLALEETAEVEGDVHTRRLALKEGGQVSGNISMGERADLKPFRAEPADVADPLAAEDEIRLSAAHGR